MNERCHASSAHSFGGAILSSDELLLVEHIDWNRRVKEV